MDADRTRARTPPQPVNVQAARAEPIFAETRSRYTSADSYYVVRNREMASMRAQQVFIVQPTRPNYGVWDGFFLGMMVSNLTRPGYSDWAYSHRDSSEYRQWHADQMQLAEQNGELRERMAALDAKVGQMQRDGVKPQAANILPEGVSSAVAVAPEAMLADFEESAPNAHTGSGHGWLIAFAIIGLLGVGFVVVMIRRGKAK